MPDGEKGLLIEAAATDLFAEVLGRFGELRLRVSGTSMLPAIRPGDTLVVHRCAIEELCTGDVVLFKDGRRLFAHRVSHEYTGMGAAAVLTKGDALAHQDPPVSRAQVLGRVTDIRTGPGPSVLRGRRRFAMIRSACSIATHNGNLALARLQRW